MRHLTFAFRIDMQHNHEGAPAVGGHGVEEMAQSLKAAC
jgi:hypothetical protein